MKTTSHTTLSLIARNSSTALTLVELIAMVAVVALLVAFFAYAQTPDRDEAMRLRCVNNLKQVGLSYRVWEGDYGDRYPMSVPSAQGGSRESGAGPTMFRHYLVMSNELSSPNILVCPSDDRTAASRFSSLSNSNLSYFVGLDADETMPAMLLSGDRNLATNGQPVSAGLVTLNPTSSVGWTEKIHNLAGNVGLADGSVQQTSSASVQMLINNSGTNLTRLAIP